MDDVLGYAGKRVIVTGAAAGVGAATTALLVDLGAEVHAIDASRPAQSALASFTEADVADRAQVEAAVERIGAVVNALFHCAEVPGTLQDLTELVVPKMIPGAAIATTSGDAYVATQAAPLARQGVRINCVDADGTATDSETVAWPLLFLNSPRASAVTGATLPAAPA